MHMHLFENHEGFRSYDRGIKSDWATWRLGRETSENLQGTSWGSHGLPWAPMKNKVWSRWPQYDRKLKPTKLFHDKGEEVETEVD